jgi:hypothetical protein
LSFEGTPTQVVKVSLVKESAAEAAPAPAPAPAPSKSRRPSSSKKKSSSSSPTKSGGTIDPFGGGGGGGSKKKKKKSGGAKTAQIGIAPAPGAPPAKVTVDGKSVGKTPVVSVAVSPGRHTIKCTFPDGKTTSQTVSVSDGPKKIVRCAK